MTNFEDFRSGKKNETRIYFIEGCNRIKIGFSKDPLKRMDDMQTGSPVKLTLIGSFYGTRDKEKKIHRKFTNIRVFGEWFRKSGDLIRFLNQQLELDKMVTGGTSGIATGTLYAKWEKP